MNVRDGQEDDQVQQEEKVRSDRIIRLGRVLGCIVEQRVLGVCNRRGGVKTWEKPEFTHTHYNRSLRMRRG